MVKMPIRNKSKDNPYTLGYDDDKNIYIVEFKDCKQINQKVEINKEIYDAFDKFELEDISQIHKYRKHIEHSEVYDYTLYKRAVNAPKSVDNIVEDKMLIESLKDALEKLSEVQKRRLVKYFFENKNEYQIAREESTTQQAIHKTINLAIIKLKQILKK